MPKHAKRWLPLVLVGLAAGCGGGDGAGSGPAAKPGTVNKSGASSVVSQTTSIKTAADSGNGQGLGGTITGIAMGGAQSIVQPGEVARSLTQALTEQAQAQTTSGTVNCDAAGACVYNKFTTSNAGSTVIMDGTVKSTKTGDSTQVVTDLTMETTTGASGVGITLKYDVTGTLTISPTSIDGSLTADGDGSLSGVQGAPTSNIKYKSFNQVKYNALVLSGGSATGGSIYAKWATSVSGSTAGNSAWEGTVTYP